MIELTRFNGHPMVLNSDLIKTAEASPDTMLTLINGEKLIVREEIAEVMERVLAYRARFLAAVARQLHVTGAIWSKLQLSGQSRSWAPRAISATYVESTSRRLSAEAIERGTARTISRGTANG